jgi:hypothetical protein
MPEKPSIQIFWHIRNLRRVQFWASLRHKRRQNSHGSYWNSRLSISTYLFGPCATTTYLRFLFRRANWKKRILGHRENRGNTNLSLGPVACWKRGMEHPKWPRKNKGDNQELTTASGTMGCYRYDSWAPDTT